MEVEGGGWMVLLHPRLFRERKLLKPHCADVQSSVRPTF
jgi:hypothetical protein